MGRESGKERWKLDLGSSGLERRLPESLPPYAYDYLHSSPTVAGGIVHIGSISAVPYYFPGVDLVAGFFAVDRQTGEERWRMIPEAVEGYVTGGVFAAPAADAGIVYVASLDGRIHAIRE